MATEPDDDLISNSLLATRLRDLARLFESTHQNHQTLTKSAERLDAVDRLKLDKLSELGKPIPS